MEIPIDVKVLCKDGEAGHTAAIIMDPATQQVTHVVVRGKGTLLGEFLVPVDAIDKSNPHELTLLWSLVELAAAQRFDKAILVGDGGVVPGSAMMWPYAGVSDMNFGAPMPSAFVQVEEVPESGIAVHVGAHVNATDGRVGKVDEFLIDRKTSAITHVILRHGHLWGKHDISVPVSDIDHVQDDVVYLKIDKKAIEALPIVPKPL
jgi:sporulation protein YlmC with PRC-barrel domain